MNKTILLAINFLLPLLLFSQPQRLYVNQTANGQNNGSSWTDAFTNLHDALALAEAGDEIWVAEGIYRPSDAGDRSARFQMLSGVRLYGGFAGTELDLSERDWQPHPSIFDGDIGTAGDSTDNTHNLLYLYRPDSLTLVDGFIFRYAFADNPAAPAGEPGSSGAALYIMAFDGEAYPVIRNCTFEHNAALKHGGAVYVNGGGSGSVAPLFDNCRFTANRAVEGNGGALYRNGGSWVDRQEDVKGCVFEQNLANRQGGAIFFADSPRSDKFDITQTVLQHNRAFIPWGAPGVNSGSALFATSTRSSGASTVSLHQCKVIGNGVIHSLNIQYYSSPFSTAPQWIEAGNLIFHFDSVYFEQNNGTCNGESFGWLRLLINNSTFYRDTIRTHVETGDAVDYDTSKVTNTKILHSVGGITSSSSTLYIENVTCAHNRGTGFGMTSLWADAEIIANNLVAYGNTLSYSNFDNVVYKSGVILSPHTYWGGTWKSTVRLSNSSAYDNIIKARAASEYVYYKNNAFFLTGDECQPFSGFSAFAETAVFDHNIINLPDTFNAPVWVKTGNIWETDPQFVNPDSGDLRLSPCSPARDAGNNAAVVTATDIAGNPRIQGGIVDIGAYESPAFGLAAEPDIKAACAGQPDGAIIAPLVSACEPLTVAWQSGAQSGSALDSLAPGTYSVTMTDAQGRSLTFSASVPIAQPPTFQVDGSPISCYGAADASLAVMPLSGKPPYAYLWSPPVTTDSIATGLGPGPVSVTVTDDWGCTATFSFSVPQPDTLKFAATVTNASTPQSADGSILVNNVMGGTAPYDYLWEPGGSTGDILMGLNPGFYTLTVTDERGCEAVQTFEVKAVLETGEAVGRVVLIIYPNPARESATIKGEFENATPFLIEIYDTKGRLLRSERVSPLGDAWQVSLEELAAGQYVVVLRNAKGEISGRGSLMKQ